MSVLSKYTMALQDVQNQHNMFA